MKRFLLLYSGPPAPPGHAHEGWREWFESIGEALVDIGSPMVNGVVLHDDGSTSDPSSLRGYGIVQAEDRTGALGLLADHPLLALGGDYAIEVFELPRK